MIFLISFASRQKRWQGAFDGEFKRSYDAAGVSFPVSGNCSNSLLRYSVLCECFHKLKYGPKRKIHALPTIVGHIL